MNSEVLLTNGKAFTDCENYDILPNTNMSHRKNQRAILSTTTLQTTSSILLTNMPPKSKKGKKPSTKKAVEATSLSVEPETTGDDNAMQTDQPEPEPSTSTSLVNSAAVLVETSENAVAHAVDAIKEKVADVAEAAEEFVEDMTMAVVEENAPGSSKSGDVTPAEPETEEKEETKKMTLEERKAKLDQLRKKMVRLVSSPLFSFSSCDKMLIMTHSIVGCFNESQSCCTCRRVCKG